MWRRRRNQHMGPLLETAHALASPYAVHYLVCVHHLVCVQCCRRLSCAAPLSHSGAVPPSHSGTGAEPLSHAGTVHDLLIMAQYCTPITMLVLQPSSTPSPHAGPAALPPLTSCWTSGPAPPHLTLDQRGPAPPHLMLDQRPCTP